MRAALAALAMMGICAGPALAASDDLSGAWSGFYAYDGADEVEFDAVVTHRNGKLTGKITEPNTFGAPGVARLSATFEGDVDVTGIVQFVKTYDGTGGVSHDVQYVGKLIEEGRCIVGAWRIDQSSGPFQMCRGGAPTS